jgi:mercuric ion transport protein
MLVQLLFFPDCPNVDAARRTLAQALSELDEPPTVVELDVTDSRTPPHLRAWGSPTILVDGQDVAGGAPSDACCRLYSGSEQRGAPALAAVEAALRRSANLRPAL